MVVDTLARSTDILLLMAFFVALLLVLISTVMYLLERGNWDEALGYYVRPQEYIFLTDAQGNSVPQPSPFSNVPMGFWWTIVTMLTVGYGDVVGVCTHTHTHTHGDTHMRARRHHTGGTLTGMHAGSPPCGRMLPAIHASGTCSPTCG